MFSPANASTTPERGALVKLLITGTISMAVGVSGDLANAKGFGEVLQIQCKGVAGDNRGSVQISCGGLAPSGRRGRS